MDYPDALRMMQRCHDEITEQRKELIRLRPIETAYNALLRVMELTNTTRGYAERSDVLYTLESEIWAAKHKLEQEKKAAHERAAANRPPTGKPTPDDPGIPTTDLGDAVNTLTAEAARDFDKAIATGVASARASQTTDAAVSLNAGTSAALGAGVGSGVLAGRVKALNPEQTLAERQSQRIAGLPKDEPELSRVNPIAPTPEKG